MIHGQKKGKMNSWEKIWTEISHVRLKDKLKDNGGNLKIELGALRNWSWEPEIFKQLCLTKEWAIKLDWIECVK